MTSTNTTEWSQYLSTEEIEAVYLNRTNLVTSSKAKPRIVLSYGHNGFGNQLWEHSIAFMISQSLKAKMLVATIPDSLSPGGYLPPNTISGMAAMERLLPDDYEYESLPQNSSIRTICDSEPFYISDRPVDWRDRNYSTNFRHNLYNLLTDSGPRCLKFVGYFQNLPLCDDDVRYLWTERMLANFTTRPNENDLSIYLRCLPRHYHFNDRHYYETILNNTDFDHIWLFMAPECPTKLGSNPAKDGLVASVVRLLIERFNATRWPQYTGADDTTALLHDLAGLIMSKKLILPLSSWAFWAGLLSNATEIHVNAPPHHPVMNNRPQYIYHSDRSKSYFGIYNSSLNDIEFAISEKTIKSHIYPLKSLRPATHSPSQATGESYSTNRESNSTVTSGNSTGSLASDVNGTVIEKNNNSRRRRILQQRDSSTPKRTLSVWDLFV